MSLDSGIILKPPKLRKSGSKAALALKVDIWTCVAMMMPLAF